MNIDENTSTVVIIGTENNTYLFLQLKILLEMTGFIVLDFPKHFKRENYSFHEINIQKDNVITLNGISYNLKEIDIYSFANKLNNYEYFTKDKDGKTYINNIEFNLEELLQTIYSINYLYTAKQLKKTAYNNYDKVTEPNIKLILKYANYLADLIRKIEKELNNSNNWIFYYNYFYFLKIINIATNKIRTYNFSQYHDYKEKYDKLITLNQKRENIKLLLAELIQEDNIYFGRCSDYYKELINSNELGVKYKANYQLCFVKYKNMVKNKNTWNDFESFNKASKKIYTYYDYCISINSDDIRLNHLNAILLKTKARLYVEKYNYNSHINEISFLEDTIIQYNKIINLILSKDISQRLTSDFEKLHTCYFCLGLLQDEQELHDEAINNFRNIEKVWTILCEGNKYYNNTLIRRIYPNNHKEIEEILINKYFWEWMKADENIIKIKKKGNYNSYHW